MYPEYAVHSLEHARVGDLPPHARSGVHPDPAQRLNGRTHTLLSPRSTQTSPIVLTAWNAQLNVEKASDPRVGKFIQKYEQGGTAPEIGASCSGGVRPDPVNRTVPFVALALLTASALGPSYRPFTSCTPG
ncbi:DUF3105 domain-containing protein [Deinococcus metalli]|uniref:DUF3105 domain-containing protein n=1 Tax=Deinococcus metalli TaxID=1141878 RepID=UPI0036127AD6